MSHSSARRSRSLSRSGRVLLASIILFAMTFGMLAVPSRANARSQMRPLAPVVSQDIVISQVYGGGGNSGATYTHDFIELFNRGTLPVNIGGWSVQYTSATGTGNFGANTTLITPLPAISINPGQYFLVQEASQAAVGAPLPTPDQTDATPIAMAAGAGKVALVNDAVTLGCNGSTVSCAGQLARIVDLVGYGTGASGANFFEGSGPAPTISATTSDQRNGNGCNDTDNNSADFTAATPTPRNTNSPTSTCGVVTPTDPTGVGAATPNTVGTGDSTLLTVTVTPGTDPASTGLAVTANLTAIGGVASQTFTEGPANVFSFQATVAPGTTPGAKILPASITDGQARTGNANISLIVTAPPPPGEPLPFGQNWSNTNLISADDDWGGVPGIVGYLGSGLTGGTGVDPQTILTEGTPVVDVIANQANPNVVNSGGVAEFHLPDPVVALQGSGTASAPNLVISVNTTGQTNITVFYNLRDVDGSADNSVQPVALQYRVGNAGNFTNVPAAFVADASSGPSEDSLITPVAVVLPSAVNNKPLVQLRIITTNAVGNDEWIGIDDIQVVANGTIPLSANGSATPNRVNPGANTLLKVRVIPANNPTSTSVGVQADLSAIGGTFNQQLFNDGTHGDITSGDDIFSFDATVSLDTFSGNKVLPVSVSDGQGRSAATTISLGVNDARDPATHLVMGNPSNATVDVNNPNNYLLLKNEYVVGYNRDRGTPNWVSWHLDSSWLGTAPRQDDFRPDTTLPAGWYQVLDTDYSGSGFDRGHHTPSADRTATIPENSATFLMTNMMPQAPDNNQGPWEELESFSRTLVNQGNELYIVGGGTGIGGTGFFGGVTQTIANGHVTVPAFTWKVIMVLPNGGNDVSRVDHNTRTIAVIMPNTQGIRNDAWQKYLATVDQVEALTGQNYFSNVPEGIQSEFEAKLDAPSNTAPTAQAQSVNASEDTPLGITLTASDPNINNVLTYSVTQQPTNGTLSGSGANITYSPNENFHGSDSFTFEASDGGATSSATISINVASVNDPPSLDPISDKTVNLGNPLTFTAIASDVDLPDDSLGYSLTGIVPTGASINPVTGVFSWTPTAAQAGSIYSFGVRVTDAGALYSDQTVNIAVAYTWSGVLGSAVLGADPRAGSSVPVKFRLTGASAGVSDAEVRLFIAPVVNGVVGPEGPAVARGSQNVGNLFAYDSSSGEYYFIWNTSGLSAGSYQLRIDTGDGVVRTLNVTLR